MSELDQFHEAGMEGMDKNAILQMLDEEYSQPGYSQPGYSQQDIEIEQASKEAFVSPSVNLYYLESQCDNCRLAKRLWYKGKCTKSPDGKHLTSFK